MNIIDISWPITPDMTTYKDKGGVALETLKTFEKFGVRESVLHLNAHTGTHVDAPSHFLAHGCTTEHIPLSTYIGPAIVLDCTQADDCVDRKFLQNKLLAHDFSTLPKNPIMQHSRPAPQLKEVVILLKTTNSLLSPTADFHQNFVYLEKSGAEYLADQNIKAVGIDYLGIERNQPNHETHTILLEKRIGIIEGLRLAPVAPGNYFVLLLPLAVLGTEAAPARAVLIS